MAQTNHSQNSGNVIHLKIDSGYTVYPSMMDMRKVVYPVGSLWATNDPDANPGTVMGFGSWRKVSPGPVTWQMLEDSTWNIEGTVLGYYIWERIE